MSAPYKTISQAFLCPKWSTILSKPSLTKRAGHVKIMNITVCIGFIFIRFYFTFTTAESLPLQEIPNSPIVLNEELNIK